jgi:hypothetical protein
MTSTHPTQTSAYWLNLARTERTFAEHARTSRTESVESIRIHLANADDYEARAKQLQADGK